MSVTRHEVPIKHEPHVVGLRGYARNRNWFHIRNRFQLACERKVNLRCRRSELIVRRLFPTHRHTRRVDVRRERTAAIAFAAFRFHQLVACFVLR